VIASAAAAIAALIAALPRYKGAVEIHLDRSGLPEI
jgi:hypothetical protein